MNKITSNKCLNPTPESVAALRGIFRGGAGLEKRYILKFYYRGKI